MTLGSIVIAAHQEEAVIERVLGHLTEIAQAGLVDVIVVCNGCTDRTATLARSFAGVRVLELAQPSKTAALREGDRVAGAGPRIYLDADVEMTGAAAVATLRALSSGALAGRPPRSFETSHASWPVRRWYAVRSRLPSIANTLWGAGCYALSPAGRARFDTFPDAADDLFVHRLFAPEEVTIVPTDPVVVRTPRRLRYLMRVLRRAYRTQRDFPKPDGGGSFTPSSGQRQQARDLRDLLRHEPTRVVDVCVYLAVVVLARAQARLGPAPRWERDTSSRAPK